VRLQLIHAFDATESELPTTKLQVVLIFPKKRDPSSTVKLLFNIVSPPTPRAFRELTLEANSVNPATFRVPFK
jgi:hypothetical protein